MGPGASHLLGETPLGWTSGGQMADDQGGGHAPKRSMTLNREEKNRASVYLSSSADLESEAFL